MDFTEPIPQEATDINLVFHNRHVKSVMILDPDRSITYDDLSQEIQYTRRQARPLVKEWARLNVKKIPAFFSKMADDSKVASKYSPYYERVRLIFKNLGKSAPIVIDQLEGRMTTLLNYDDEQSSMKLADLDRHIEDMEIVRSRLKLARGLINESKSDAGRNYDRTAHREAIIALPSLGFIKKVRANLQKNQNTYFRRLMDHTREVEPNEEVLEEVAEISKNQQQLEAPDAREAARKARHLRSKMKTLTLAQRDPPPGPSRKRSSSSQRQRSADPSPGPSRKRSKTPTPAASQSPARTRSKSKTPAPSSQRKRSTSKTPAPSSHRKRSKSRTPAQDTLRPRHASRGRKGKGKGRDKSTLTREATPSPNPMSDEESPEVSSRDEPPQDISNQSSREDTPLEEPVFDLEYPSPPPDSPLTQMRRILLRNPMYESSDEEDDSQNVSMEESSQKED